MPEPKQILEGLGSIAGRYSSLAIGWHILIAAVAVALLSGSRPSRRLGAFLPIPVLISVGALALIHRNPFNGIVFLAFSVILSSIAAGLPAAKVRLDNGWPFGAGVCLILFGTFYPHFLAGGWTRYLYAAPVGLIPCPTLSVILGLALVLGGFGSRAYSLCLAALGFFYGLFGAFRLGVRIDVVLVAGAAALLAAALRPVPSER
jgi:hypothetical protein